MKSKIVTFISLIFFSLMLSCSKGSQDMNYEVSYIILGPEPKRERLRFSTTSYSKELDIAEITSNSFHRLQRLAPGQMFHLHVYKKPSEENSISLLAFFEVYIEKNEEGSLSVIPLRDLPPLKNGSAKEFSEEIERMLISKIQEEE